MGQEKTVFAVRGGGHNINAGFAGVCDGVTIDMRGMKGVDLNEEEMVVRVGAGALWQDVYDVVEGKGLEVVGGRIGDVGVGGLVLGGKL